MMPLETYNPALEEIQDELLIENNAFSAFILLLLIIQKLYDFVSIHKMGNVT